MCFRTHPLTHPPLLQHILEMCSLTYPQCTLTPPPPLPPPLPPPPPPLPPPPPPPPPLPPDSHSRLDVVPRW